VHGAPLAEIKRLLSGASLFVGNDSGPAHMAAAFGVPVVEIFGTADAAIWGPWRTAAEVVTAPGGVSGVETAQVSGSAWRGWECTHEASHAAALLWPPLLGAFVGSVILMPWRARRRPSCCC